MKPLLVPGGRAFVWPSVQRVQRYARMPFPQKSLSFYSFHSLMYLHSHQTEYR